MKKTSEGVRTRVGPRAAIIALVALSVPAAVSANQFESLRFDGSWQITVTAIDPPLGSMTSLMTFVPGGGVVESRRPYVPLSPFGPLLETSGHGDWARIGVRDFAVKFVFLLQGAPEGPAPGEDLGTDNIRMRLRLNADGTQVTGTFRSQVKDSTGNVVFSVTGTVAGTRIDVFEPEE